MEVENYIYSMDDFYLDAESLNKRLELNVPLANAVLVKKTNGNCKIMQISSDGTHYVEKLHWGLLLCLSRLVRERAIFAPP